jgi:hypothetical protein
MTSPNRPYMNLVVDDQQLATLMWLADRTSEEQQTLRDMDDKLFSWSATLFVTAFGALAGLNGLTAREWGPLWRTLLCLGIVCLVGALLVLASQIRNGILRKRGEFDALMAQMAQAAQRQPMQVAPADVDNGLFFYVRWGMIMLLGAITLVLTWLTFS